MKAAEEEGRPPGAAHVQVEDTHARTHVHDPAARQQTPASTWQARTCAAVVYAKITS